MLARRAGHTREAEVVEILERANDTFVGQLQVEKNFAFLITESRTLASDIFIPKDKLKGGKTGDKAVVQITEWPDNSKSPIGRVVDILGRQGENNAENHFPFIADCVSHCCTAFHRNIFLHHRIQYGSFRYTQRPHEYDGIRLFCYPYLLFYADLLKVNYL